MISDKFKFLLIAFLASFFAASIYIYHEKKKQRRDEINRIIQEARADLKTYS